jgi:F1F0 ATPase subunit 2
MDASAMSDAVIREYLVLICGAAGWFAVGGMLGAVHFLSLRWNVRCTLEGQPLFSLGLQLLRFTVTGAALVLVTRLFGAMPLLASVLGLMAARTGVLKEPQ